MRRGFWEGDWGHPNTLPAESFKKGEAQILSVKMGGISLTVFTKEKPEQSLFKSYILLHPKMYVKGQLARDRAIISRTLEFDLAELNNDPEGVFLGFMDKLKR